MKQFYNNFDSTISILGISISIQNIEQTLSIILLIFSIINIVLKLVISFKSKLKDGKITNQELKELEQEIKETENELAKIYEKEKQKGRE